MKFIGDVHGKFDRYKTIISSCKESIQVGDMGVGFMNWHGEYSANPPYDAMTKGDHRFIRGNHDNPAVCARHTQWIPDGHIELGTMFIGGAVSIDREFRIEGQSYWRDEELSYSVLAALTDTYIEAKPSVMVTHECPQDIAQEMQRMSGRDKLRPEWASRTRQALQAMWSNHSPAIWIFGHWHKSADFMANGTRFICLDELETIDLDV